MTRAGSTVWPNILRGRGPRDPRFGATARRSEIGAFLGGVTGNVATRPSNVKPVVRHNVANVLFTELTPDQAHVSSYFTVVTHIGLDHFGRYRDAFVPDGDTWLIKHRKVSTDWAAPNSAMTRQPPAHGGG